MLLLHVNKMTDVLEGPGKQNTAAAQELTQYSIMSCTEKESKKVDTCMSRFAVQQKQTQYCINQLKVPWVFPHYNPNFSQELAFISVALQTADPTN